MVLGIKAQVSNMLGSIPPLSYTLASTFKIFFMTFNYVSVCLCVGMCIVLVSEVARSALHPLSNTRVAGTCELPSIGAGNQTQVLCKSSNCT